MPDTVTPPEPIRIRPLAAVYRIAFRQAERALAAERARIAQSKEPKPARDVAADLQREVTP